MLHLIAKTTLCFKQKREMEEGKEGGTDEKMCCFLFQIGKHSKGSPITHPVQALGGAAAVPLLFLMGNLCLFDTCAIYTFYVFFLIYEVSHLP